MLPFALAFALALALVPTILAADATPQESWMVHVDGSGDALRYVPDRLVIVPGGTVQLMVFGQGHGRYSLTLDEPGYDAEVDTAAGGVVHVAEFAAPTALGEYPFHDRYHESATGTLVVAKAAPVVGVGNGYDTRFYPDRLEVRAGETITFRNNASEIIHTMTALDGWFDADAVRAGETRTIVAPTEPGEHAFVCKYHQDSGMRGTLVVLPAEPARAAPAEEVSTERASTPGIGLALVLGLAALAALATRDRR